MGGSHLAIAEWTDPIHLATAEIPTERKLSHCARDGAYVSHAAPRAQGGGEREEG